MRDLISATGTPQNPSAKKIGPRPDRQRALSRVGAHRSSDGQAWPGRRVPLDLVDIDSPGKVHRTAASFGSHPGIELADNRVIPVNPDALFHLSLSGLTNLFRNFKGHLGSKGHATAGLEILNEPFVVGVSLQLAFVVIDPGLPTGTGTISNPWAIKITRKP